MTRPFKILHLHTRAIVGGSGANTLLTLAGLPGEHFSGHLACGRQDSQRTFLSETQDKKITVHLLPHLINSIHPVYDFLALIEIFRLIKKENFTIVHTHNSKAGILGRLAAKLAGAPVIIHTIHSCEFNYEHANPVLKNIFLWLEKWAASFTDELIAISPHLKEEFLKHRLAPAQKIAVIYSGINIEDFKKEVDISQKRRELKVPEGDFAVGVIARLEEGKGHEVIIEAAQEIFRKRNSIKFLFVGDGPLRGRLEKKIKNANMDDHFIFAGLRSDVPEILKALDLVCLPSFYEGMGRVVLEAQAAQCAVVASRSGGIVDITKDGETALLVPRRDSKQFAAAIEKFLENPVLRKDMAKKASDFIDERFSAKKMVSDIILIYQRQLKQKQIQSP